MNDYSQNRMMQHGGGNALPGEPNPNLPTEESARMAVRNLQRFLRTLSYSIPEIPDVPIDGVFDSATREAVEAFQQLRELPVTGEADRATWDLIYLAYLDALFDASEPDPLAIFPQAPADYAVKRGDEGFLVETIRFLLREIETLYGFTELPERGDTYDERTENAIYEFQKMRLLPETGEVDKRTWNQLIDAYRTEDNAREQSYGL